MGALDRNALFSRTLAPTFHGKLLPPRSRSCSIGSWIIRKLDASDQFRPFARPNSWPRGRGDKSWTEFGWPSRSICLRNRSTFNFDWAHLAAL